MLIKLLGIDVIRHLDNLRLIGYKRLLDKERQKIIEYCKNYIMEIDKVKLELYNRGKDLEMEIYELETERVETELAGTYKPEWLQ